MTEAEMEADISEDKSDDAFACGVLALKCDTPL